MERKKKKHGYGTNFNIPNTLIKRKFFFKFFQILFRSTTNGKLQNMEHIPFPFFSHQAKTRNGTIKSMYISMYEKKKI